eukprot:CAMPEP_0184298602 /NCGR_PEP_ID=MMETSP1049-20130417/9382_1 /TAXON_ID=77928 /ORGANISM="Proteomonas sulcata, Strain CCMP704" /LENGTH=132 /DNA_ID=CAMNT_0026608775 /DNA_START=265 /DNA_END=663 /DNA_ORIENTATION=+
MGVQYHQLLAVSLLVNSAQAFVATSQLSVGRQALRASCPSHLGPSKRLGLQALYSPPPSRDAEYLQQCFDETWNEELNDEALRKELKEMGFTEDLIEYTMEERRKRQTPPPGTPPYKGLAKRFYAMFGIHIE